jgi:hypothetical protein
MHTAYHKNLSAFKTSCLQATKNRSTTELGKFTRVLNSFNRFFLLA